MKRLVLFLCGILLACGADFSGGNAYAQQLPRFGKRVYPKAVATAPCILDNRTMAVRTTPGMSGQDATDGMFTAGMSRLTLQIFDLTHIDSPRVAGPRARLNAALR
jgi:hypothetical protein